MKKTFSAVIHSEGNSYVAECPEIGTVSQGSTINEAIENLKESTELYIEETGYVPTESEVMMTTFEAVL